MFFNLLQQAEILLYINNFYHEIDMKELKPGVYLLHIKSEEAVYYLKWIKE